MVKKVKSKEEENKFKKYGKSKDGNYYIKDCIGVPHPYCIGAKHLELNDGMVLNIESTEEKGAQCEICKKLVRDGKLQKVLTYKEHERALVVVCKKEPKEKSKYHKELHDFLLKIKDKVSKDGYAGFTFLKEF